MQSKVTIVNSYVEDRLGLELDTTKDMFGKSKSNFYFDGIHKKAVYAEFKEKVFFGSNKVAGILTPDFVLKLKLLSDSENCDDEYKKFIKISLGKIPEPENLLVIKLKN